MGNSNPGAESVAARVWRGATGRGLGWLAMRLLVWKPRCMVQKFCPPSIHSRRAARSGTGRPTRLIRPGSCTTAMRAINHDTGYIQFLNAAVGSLRVTWHSSGISLLSRPVNVGIRCAIYSISGSACTRGHFCASYNPCELPAHALPRAISPSRVFLQLTGAMFTS